MGKTHLPLGCFGGLFAGILAGSAGLAAGQSGFANFEVAPIHAVEMTADGTKLLVCNTADNRLEVFTLGGALPACSLSIPAGLSPVSVRARTNTEAWVVNQISDTISIIDLSAGNVVATLTPGNEPCDVVFFGSGSAQRAYVSVSRENLLRVYDPNVRTAPPTTIALAGTCPKSLATDGTRIFAAFFEAGNRTTVAPRSIVDDPTGPWAGANPPPNVNNGTFSPAMTPGLPAAPASALILNKEGNPGNWKDAANIVWDSKVPWGLHEHGVAIYTVGTGVLTYASNIANINMALTVQPTTGKVTVVGHHLTNYVRFEPNHRSQFGRSFLSFFVPTSPPGPTGAPGAGTTDLNTHLFANGVSLPYTMSPTPAQVQASATDPRALAWKDSANGYVACMGTNNVVRVNGNGARQAVINVGQGPCGLAVDTTRSRVYVLNRFDGTVSSINTATDAIVGTVPFYDPTPVAVKAGRPVFYDAHLTSKLGIVSCNSCHVDTRSDMESWDAGDPSGQMKVFNQTCDAALPFTGSCNDWHPIKGPLMTQNLADTVGFGPLHWRGDKEDIHAFTGGFTGFLGLASPPSDPQMQQLSDFFATLRRMPNPYRVVTGGLPASVPGFSGNPASGQALFNGPALGSAARCVDCHAVSSGGGLTIISPNVLGQSQGLKAPPLRDLYVKTGFDRSSTTSRRGFGFAHDGATQTIQELLQNHFAPSAAAQDRADLEAYLMCFDSGTHPAVGVQVTFDSVTKNDPAAIGLYNTLTSLADSGTIGVVAKGVVGGQRRGYMYTGSGTFQSDRIAETISTTLLRSGAATGSEMTITAVVAGTQRREGIDRDGDLSLDRDELDLGYSPNDPASVPSACRPNISQQPSGTAVNSGQSATFSVNAAGSAPLLYQWRRSGVNVVNGAGGASAGGGAVSGATAATIMISGCQASDAGSYDCVVSNPCGPTVSGAAALSVHSCGSADFNGDGDIGTDADIEAFFACLSGSCCATCGSADFNADGDLGTDADIEAFFSVLGGGTC